VDDCIPAPTPFDSFERRLWAGRAEPFSRTFAPLCAHMAGPLLSAVRVTEGTRLLDVGTGVGTVAVAAARHGARVTAVDAEPSMVEATARALPEAEVRLALLPSLPFPDAAFDAVTANFVLNHVGTPLAAAAELLRVLRPGGRVAVTVWPRPPSTLHSLWEEAQASAGITRSPDHPAVEPALDFPRTPNGLGDLLRGAGAIHVAAGAQEWTHTVARETWLTALTAQVGAMGALMADQPPRTVAQVRNAFDALSLPFRQDDDILALPTAAVLACGQRGRH
jgi:SAM-dependent methyltransferase